MMSHEELEQYVRNLETELRATNQNLGGFQKYVEDKLGQIFSRIDEILNSYHNHMSNPDIPGPSMSGREIPSMKGRQTEATGTYSPPDSYGPVNVPESKYQP